MNKINNELERAQLGAASAAGCGAGLYRRPETW